MGGGAYTSALHHPCTLKAGVEEPILMTTSPLDAHQPIRSTEWASDCCHLNLLSLTRHRDSAIYKIADLSAPPDEACRQSLLVTLFQICSLSSCLPSPPLFHQHWHGLLGLISGDLVANICPKGELIFLTSIRRTLSPFSRLTKEWRESKDFRFSGNSYVLPPPHPRPFLE